MKSLILAVLWILSLGFLPAFAEPARAEPA